MSSTEPEARLPVRAVAWLLVLPLAGVLLPPLYNVREPLLLGVPFFYWYQLAWVPLSVVCLLVVYRATRGGRR